MAEIRKLSSHIADLIAAGEVVERPMSVIKELLENAIDADSKNIVIEIENGGISYIRITDDGKGMTESDAKICFLRHATSKIYDENDLYAIKTLGFRGEALAAISAVSKIDLFTKKKDDLDGTLVKVLAGQVIETTKIGTRDGTTIIVRDLFYNTPARMKFLKKDYTEASYITGMIENIALSHPEIAFKYIKDNKIMLKTNGNSDLKATIYSVLGKDISNEVLEVSSVEIDGISVSGYISKPHFAKATRNLQYIFVNGRYIKSKIISVALLEAYKNSVMTGKFPICVLNIQIDESKVDVNVHPTKTEIKFENEKKIFDIVYMSCKNALEKTNILVNISDVKIKENIFEKEEIISEPISFSSVNTLQFKPTSKINDQPIDTLHNTEITYQKSQQVYSNNKAIYIENDDFEQEIPQQIPKQVVNYKVLQPTIRKEINEENASIIEDIFEKPIKFIGECFNTFILCEFDGDLIMIDKHAAHERINFNKLVSEKENITSQVLLSPQIINLPREEYGNFIENLDDLNEIGFFIEDFSNGSIVIREVPAVLENEVIEDTIFDISSKLMHNKNVEIDKIDDILHTIACKSAIKGNRFTDEYELTKLAKQVLLNSDVNYCPHGRPVKISITKKEIEKMFKRIL